MQKNRAGRVEPTDSTTRTISGYGENREQSNSPENKNTAVLIAAKRERHAMSHAERKHG